MVWRVRILLSYGSNGSECEYLGLVMDQGRLELHALMLLQFGVDGVMFVCVGTGCFERVRKAGTHSTTHSAPGVGGGRGGSAGGSTSHLVPVTEPGRVRLKGDSS